MLHVKTVIRSLYLEFNAKLNQFPDSQLNTVDYRVWITNFNEQVLRKNRITEEERIRHSE